MAKQRSPKPDSSLEAEFVDVHPRHPRFGNKTLVAVALMSAVVGAISYVLTSSDYLRFTQYQRATFTLFSVASLAVGASALIWAYLKGGLFPSSPPSASISWESDVLVGNELASLRSEVAALRHGTSPGEKTEDLSRLRSAITDEVVSLVEQRLVSEAQAKAHLQELRSTFANAYTRLAEALAEINRRGTLNLFIGVVITGLGATGLGYMVFTAPPLTDMTGILTHYIPRLSTIVFIEVFAFFFLRLYKATLSDSNFYQSELTYLASIDIALQAAMKTNDATVMAAVISQIAASRKSVVGASGSKDGEIDAKGVGELVQQVVKLLAAAKGEK